MKAVQGFRVKKYPVHQVTEPFLRVPEMDPIFVKAANCKVVGLAATDPLVISKAGENMDWQLYQVQKAMRGSMVTACDPAIASAIIQDIFEASQDVIDQIGRSSALQHYSRRLQAVKYANIIPISSVEASFA